MTVVKKTMTSSVTAEKTKAAAEMRVRKARTATGMTHGGRRQLADWRR